MKLGADNIHTVNQLIQAVYRNERLLLMADKENDRIKRLEESMKTLLRSKPRTNAVETLLVTPNKPKGPPINKPIQKKEYWFKPADHVKAKTTPKEPCFACGSRWHWLIQCPHRDAYNAKLKEKRAKADGKLKSWQTRANFLDSLLESQETPEEVEETVEEPDQDLLASEESSEEEEEPEEEGKDDSLE